MHLTDYQIHHLVSLVRTDINGLLSTIDDYKEIIKDGFKIDYKVKISEVNKILEDLKLSDIPQFVVNNKCDLIQVSKLKSLKIRKDSEVFISAESQKLFTDLRSKINNQLFSGIYEGWISLENNLGNIRSTLFDMGCVEVEKVSSCGKMFANIKIGQEELNQFINLKGFELCRDEDILFKSIKG